VRVRIVLVPSVCFDCRLLVCDFLASSMCICRFGFVVLDFILGFVSKGQKNSVLDWYGGGKRVTTFGLCLDCVLTLSDI